MGKEMVFGSIYICFLIMYAFIYISSYLFHAFSIFIIFLFSWKKRSTFLRILCVDVLIKNPPTNLTDHTLSFALCALFFSPHIQSITKKSCSFLNLIYSLILLLVATLTYLISLSLSRFPLHFLNIYVWNWQETGASKAKEFHFAYFCNFFHSSLPCHFFHWHFGWLWLQPERTGNKI